MEPSETLKCSPDRHEQARPFSKSPRSPLKPRIPTLSKASGFPPKVCLTSTSPKTIANDILLQQTHITPLVLVFPHRSAEIYPTDPPMSPFRTLLIGLMHLEVENPGPYGQWDRGAASSRVYYHPARRALLHISSNWS